VIKQIIIKYNKTNGYSLCPQMSKNIMHVLYSTNFTWQANVGICECTPNVLFLLSLLIFLFIFNHSSYSKYLFKYVKL
jgi:hypothetical protein